MSMMRFASEEDFAAFVKKTGVREHVYPKAAARPMNAQGPRPGLPSAERTKAVAAAPDHFVDANKMVHHHIADAGKMIERKESEIERRFAQQIRAAGLPEPEREYYHITGRDFRLDFAWPARKIGVEVQGMSHRIKGKFHADIEKRALAMLAGWRILEVSGDTVRNDQAIKWLVELLR